jgi:hypothetical protein
MVHDGAVSPDPVRGFLLGRLQRDSALVSADSPYSLQSWLPEMHSIPPMLRAATYNRGRTTHRRRQAVERISDRMVAGASLAGTLLINSFRLRSAIRRFKTPPALDQHLSTYHWVTSTTTVVSIQGTCIVCCLAN